MNDSLIVQTDNLSHKIYLFLFDGDFCIFLDPKFYVHFVYDEPPSWDKKMSIAGKQIQRIVS